MIGEIISGIVSTTISIVVSLLIFYSILVIIFRVKRIREVIIRPLARAYRELLDELVKEIGPPTITPEINIEELKELSLSLCSNCTYLVKREKRFKCQLGLTIPRYKCEKYLVW